MTVMLERLTERLNRGERLVVACPDPVLAQLGLVRLCPLDHEPQPTGRQSPCEDRQMLDIDGGLISAIAGVEVRTPTVVRLVVIHPYDDPVEGANPWHRTHVRICRGWKRMAGISNGTWQSCD